MKRRRKKHKPGITGVRSNVGFTYDSDKLKRFDELTNSVDGWGRQKRGKRAKAIRKLMDKFLEENSPKVSKESEGEDAYEVETIE